MPSQSPVKSLSIDGGGVRGLAALVILELLVENTNARRRSQGLQSQEPWEMFDMIGGTSTGGLIAVMLGRLRMSLKDCKAAYISLSEQAFTPHNIVIQAKNKITLGPKFKTEPLENAIKKIVGDAHEHLRTGPEDALLKSEDENDCKVFVVSHLENIIGEPKLLRSYRNQNAPVEKYESMSIWQACRATSAATTFFDPLEIGKNRYSDGGLLYNNPVALVHSEACQMFEGREILLVSIGTGIASNREFDPKITSITNDLAFLNTQTKKDAREFYKRDNGKAAQSKRYFRFDIPGLGDVEMDESAQLNTIEEASNEYLNDPEIGSKIKSCSNELAEVYDPLEICDSLKKYIRNPRYDQIPMSHRRTFDWIWNRNAHGFPEWFTSDHDMFWISGKPGSGKSTLTKFILTHQSLSEHLATETGLISGEAHFFFHDLSGEDMDGERSFDGLLHTILWRLVELCPSFIPCINTSYERNVRYREIPTTLRSPWSTQILESCLQNIARHSSTRGIMWIFVDGFDECQGDLLSHLGFLVDWVKSMNETPFAIKLCISSRHISSMRVKFGRPQLELHEWTTNDISLYVRDKFNHTKRETLSFGEDNYSTISQSLIDLIVKKAEGVFMWVRLVVSQLLVGWADGDEEDELRVVLDALPEGDLEDLYAEIIRKIPDRYLRDGFNYFRLLIRAPGNKCSLSLLQFLIATQKPQEAIKCKDQYQPGVIDREVILRKQELMRSRLRSRCGNLVHVQQREAAQKEWDSIRRDRVVLIHRTVKDYLQKDEVQKTIRQRIHAFGHSLIPTVDVLLMASCLMLLKTQSCYVPSWAKASANHQALSGSHVEEGQRNSHTLSKDGEIQTPSYGEMDNDEYEEELDSKAPDNLITKFFNYAGNLEHALDKPQLAFIKELNRVLCKAHKKWPRKFYHRRTLCEIPDIDILCLAICWNLKLYVKATLNVKNFKKSRSRPLLFYAMNPPGWTHEPVDLEMLDIILEFGTKEGMTPNFTFKENDFNETMWGHTIRHYLRLGTADPADKWEEVLERMLRHGSDPNQKVCNRDGSFTYAVHLLVDQFVQSTTKDQEKVGKALFTLFFYGASLAVEDSDHILAEEYVKIRSQRLWNLMKKKKQAALKANRTIVQYNDEGNQVLGKRKRTRSIGTSHMKEP